MSLYQTQAVSTKTRLNLSSLGLVLLGFMFDNNASAAQDKLEAQYQLEQATCNSGQSQQDRTTCLREAGAAYAQAKQGRLSSDASVQQYRQNALIRCQALPVQDQTACRRRMDEPTALEGSVGAGGILRKEVTIIPAPGK